LPTPADTPIAILRDHARADFGDFDSVDSLTERLRDHVRDTALDVAADAIGPLAVEVVTEAMADRRVRAGYDDRDDIVESITEALRDEDVEVDEAEVDRIVGRRWEARLAEQRDWPEVTDNDRLERAFARLGATGILAEENFTCCKSCGLAEIGGELPDDTVMDGYAFFHEQDTQRAADGGTLLLAYGDFTNDEEESTAAIGRRVVAALTAEGLRTEWSGEATQRIPVALTWQRRLP
jgi:uncharacterized protein DUF6891